MRDTLRTAAYALMQHRFPALFLVLVACAATPNSAHAQGYPSYLTAIGVPSFTSPSSVENGSVNLSNGNLRLVIPIASAPQRGSRGFSAALVYESRIWTVVYGGSKSWQPINVPNSQGGWRFVTSGTPGTASNYYVSLSCYWTDPTGHQEQINYGFTYSSFQWVEPNGVIHNFPIQTSQSSTTPCSTGNGSNPTGAGYASDTSGYYMSVTNYSTMVVYAPDGSQVYPSVEDPNGNYYTADANGNVVDTLGRTQVTKTVNGSTTYYDVLNSQGGTSRYTVTTTTVNVNTSFGQSGVTEYSGNLTAVSSIALPDGTSYSFTYDSGTTAGHFGLIKTMTVPAGGQVTYAFTNFQDCTGNRNLWLNTRTSQTGTWSGTWTYAPANINQCAFNQNGGQQQVTVTQPNGDHAVHVFNLDNNWLGAWDSIVSTYDSTGYLIMNTSTTWDSSHGANYYAPTARFVSLPMPGGGSVTRQTQYVYDSSIVQNGRTTAIKEWKWYTGSYPPTPDRETDTTYVANYGRIVRLPASVTVNGSAGMLAQTKFSYDDPTHLTSKTGVTHHDDTNFSTSNTIRGNPTLIQKWVSGSTYVSSNIYYDTTGQVTQTTDPNNNSTTYQYSDTNFFTDNGANPPSAYTPSVTTNAFATQVTLPIIGSKSFGYYFNSGKPAFRRDQNGADFYSHYLDSLGRKTHIYGPAINGVRPWSLMAYSGQTQADIYRSRSDTTASVNCVNCVHAQKLKDGLRRTLHSKLVSDPEGTVNSDFVYDSKGRLLSKTNPYRSTSDSTYGTIQPSYDALNRATGVILPDSNVRQAFYGDKTSTNGLAAQLCSTSTYGVGYPVLTMDEAGNKVENWKDGFGRLIEVDEPDPSTGTLNLPTCYSYDALNNLLSVVQGSQTRTFVYDGLSRMTSQTLPESGTTTFSYLNSSGQICSGNIHAACSKTDARGIKITYAYDALNRLTSKTYSDSTPTVTYYYDQSSYNGLTIANGTGRKTGMQEASGSTVLGKTAWSYDAAGRIITEQKTVGSITKSISYSYNLDGSLASITYPSGHTVSYTYSNAGRQLSAVDTASNINYALNAQFAAHGKLSTAVYGQVSGGFAGITRSRLYNNRLQATRITDSSSNGTIKDLSYGYDLGNGINNGNVANITDNIVAGRGQNFVYDHLKRVASAKTIATSGSDCWGQSFTYDRYSNLTNIAAAQCSAPILNVAVNTATNRITTSGFSYDAAGNIANDGTQSYTWDAEKRLVSAAGVTYTYDGLGRRVQKAGGDTTTAIAWYDTKGHLLAETDASGNLTNEYIYFGGRKIARREASGTVLYYFNDRMQTNRAMTDATGNVKQMSEYYPFGGEKVITGTLDDRFKFSGKRRDSETNLDQSMHRMYEYSIGRWLTVDRGRMHLGNPQSLNRYAYVLNNPANLYDALGDDVADPFEVYNPFWSFGYATGNSNGGDVINESTDSDGNTTFSLNMPDAYSGSDLGQATQTESSDPNFTIISGGVNGDAAVFDGNVYDAGTGALISNDAEQWLAGGPNDASLVDTSGFIFGAVTGISGAVDIAAGIFEDAALTQLQDLAQPIIDNSGTFACDTCAAQLGQSFQDAGFESNMLELQGGAFDTLSMNGSTISTSGYHVGVEVNGYVFDNFVNGQEMGQWLESIQSSGGSYSVTSTPFEDWTPW